MSVWRPHTTAILVTGVIAIIIAITVSFVAANFQPKTAVSLGSASFSVSVAETPEALTRGLSGVSSLKPNDGLLFVFDRPEKWGIWMKDMKIPIDIIWLDENKKVVYIVKNAAPELSTSKTFRPDTEALYVLEVNAGAAQANNIVVGSTATFVLPGEIE